MSNYGSPGGPYPEPPRQPWPAGQPDDPYGQPNDRYGQPSDPWGDLHPWDSGTRPTSAGDPGPSGGYGPGYGGYHHPGYPGYATDRPYEHGYQPGGADPSRPPASPDPGPSWAPPVAPADPPTKNSRGPVIALVAAIAVLVIGIGAGAFFLLGREGGQATAAKATGQPNPTGTPSPTDAVATSPAAEVPTNISLVTVGQCVTDEGTRGKPKLMITECGAEGYRVLARVDGVTTGGNDAKKKCGKVSGYTDWYFYDSELDELDFVLCLKRN